MDAFLSRKRRRISPTSGGNKPFQATEPQVEDEAESTDLKLAILSSLHQDAAPEDLLDILLSCDGSVDDALQTLSSRSVGRDAPAQKRKLSSIGVQSALTFAGRSSEIDKSSKVKSLARRGKTIHLYSPYDIAAHTPCSIIHNFLPSDLAAALLRELLPEAETFESIPLKMFDHVVKSPHTASFYVDNLEEQIQRKNDYLYNGSKLDDVRQILPVMRKVSHLVREAVNKEIAIRIRDHYPNGQKLRYQTPKEWHPNAAFVNCYDGGAQSVGYHTDQLSYLGPRAVIGSLSLGVAREFRVRKIVAKEDHDNGEAADASGQVAIHLPHNSLLVMHAEMQEEWKHSIAPAKTIDPHPIAGNKRINITYRWYRDELKPEHLPKCKCGVATVLKAVQKQKQNRGRYMWMCQTQGRPGLGEGCGYFEWAEFTEDGDPIWKHQRAESSTSKKVAGGDSDGIVT